MEKANSMASLFMSFFCYGIMVSCNLNGYAEALKEYKVGDALGWREHPSNHSEIYTQWAANKRFQVGDSLFFEYKNDSLLVVNKWGYYHCDTNKPFNAYTNGSTVIKLDRPGYFYFISGTPHHCINGQRLLVNVLPSHAVSEPVPVPAAAAIPASSPMITMSPQGHARASPAVAPSLDSTSSGDFVSVAFGSVLMVLIAACFSLF